MSHLTGYAIGILLVYGTTIVVGLIIGQEIANLYSPAIDILADTVNNLPR